jgi:hypothetical protein
MAERLMTRTIRTREEIEDIRDIWVSWQNHPNSDIDFYLTIQSLRPTILRPHIIVVYRDGRPESMLVGRIEQGRIDCNIGYKTVLAPRMRVLSVVYGGQLGNWSKEHGRLMVKEVVDCLRNDEADAARFYCVRADSAVFPLIFRYSAFGCQDHFPMAQMHRSMKLSATIADVYAGLSRDHRWEIRKKSKKLLADYPNAHVECLRGVENLDLICEHVEDIAKHTYQRGLGVGFIDNAEMRTITKLELEKGWHRTYILYINDKPCAFWMGNVYAGTFHSSHLGYQRTYENYSPGTYLQARTIEELCKEGVKELDFGLGDARYKQRFGNSSWQEVSAYIFAPNLKALTLNVIRTPTAFLDQVMRQAVEKTALLPRIKKMWRNRLRRREEVRGVKPISGTRPVLEAKPILGNAVVVPERLKAAAGERKSAGL